MNKKVLFAATMAAVLASCSSDDLSLTSSTSSKQLLTDENGNPGYFFDGNSQRSLTRAGYAGVMNTDQLKASEADGGGFGVFGYYTDLNEYDQSRSSNFMYNQGVFYSGGSWTYEPVKYWPNEYGSKAQSDDVDKVTFFAYAPYVKNTPASGKVAEDQVGITGFTRNTAAGDPYVKYVGSLDPTKCVDLCWGVADPSADVEWKTIQGVSQTMAKGMPWMNVQRPEKSLGQKMKFFFKHALSQLNVQIDADVNTNKHGEGVEVDSKSKVYVRSITFNGFAMKGALNLNNEEAGVPNWKGYNCSNEPLLAEEYTIYDGMKDGKEGTGYVASNEKVTGLNEKIIQDKKWTESAEGVTKTAKNLFNSTTVDAPIYVIPTGDDMSVTIVYDIETKDDNLAGTVSDKETHGVSIENKITKTITITDSDPSQALKLEAGKKYTINLHLGLSQVEFDAVVADWDDAAAAGGAWLPGNGDGPVFVTSITISQDQEALAQNVVKLKVDEVLPSNADDKSVVWKSSDESLATINSSGIVTPATGYVFSNVTTDPAVTIYAENTASGIQSNTLTVHVKEAPIATTGISLNQGSLNMTVGGQDVTLIATVTPDNASDKTVTWESSATGVATVDANGKVHAVAAGTATITATNSGGQTATCTVNVTAANTLTTATSADVGKWVDAAGNILDSATGAAGWIAYATDNHHGLILAMENSATGKTWDEAQTVNFSGLPSIALTSGSWHLPSANGTDGEWDKMDAGIDANAASCPLSQYSDYWSSTEYDTDSAWYYHFNDAGGFVGFNLKSSSYGVRAVLAF